MKIHPAVILSASEGPLYYADPIEAPSFSPCCRNQKHMIRTTQSANLQPKPPPHVILSASEGPLYYAGAIEAPSL